MKTRKLGLVMLVVVVASFVGLPVIYAQSAKEAGWSVSITYQNVGTDTATINLAFYEEGSSTAITVDPGALAAGAGASYYIGRVSGMDDGWRGAGVISSSQPLVATVVQFSNDADFRMRLLSNGFGSSDASNQYLVPTVLLNQWSRTTVFSIQNVQDVSIDATVNLYDSAGSLVASPTHTIPANSTKYIDMSNTSDTGLSSSVTNFNGSAIVTAVLSSDGSTPADVVAAANEYYTDRPVATSFEGVALSQASTTAYMATGLCENFNLDTFYAVQNASLTDDAYIEVTYRDKDGNVVATDGRYLIGPGQKKSIRTCAPNDATDMSGFTGSAVVESYDGSTGTTPGAPLVVMGKAQNSIAAGSPDKEDVFTAFLGDGSGTSELALPFIRWATNSDFNAVDNTGGRQRAYIAIQNLEGSETKVDVTYLDKDGNAEGSETLTIPAYAKGNSNAAKAGALGSDGQFGYYGTPVTSHGGAAVVKAHSDNPDADFIAIVRVQHPGAGEDYNGIDTE
jgi:hypothetical protein